MKPFTKKNKNNLLIGFSIIALVIIKMHALLEVEDCITSGCNCLVQSDYNRSIKFQNGSLAFLQHSTGCDNCDRGKYKFEEHKGC